MQKDSPAQELAQLPVQRVKLSDIEPGPLAMRIQLDPEKLAALQISLSTLGQLNPVYIHGEKPPYKLIAGHRRCAAADALGWLYIEARIVDRDAPLLWAMAWDENEHRDGIAVTDKARWLKGMMEHNGWTQAQLAQILKMSPSHVSDILATLDYPPSLAEALESAAISHGAARALARIEDTSLREFYIHQAAEFGASARTCEEYARQAKLQQLAPQPDPDAGNGDQVDTPPPPTIVNLCACCQTPSAFGLRLLQVCPGCYTLIINPQPA